MKTTAQKVIAMIESHGRDDGGYSNAPYSMIQAWRETAVAVEYPMGTDSYDATEVWRFKDGSALWVNNPRQAAFRLGISEI